MAKPKKDTHIRFYVALHFSGINLLILQEEIRFVEVIEDVQTQLEEGEDILGVAGWLSHGEEQFPVFCLNEHLTLQNTVPDNRRYCVILETAGEEATFGILCEDMDPLDPRYPLHIQPIPTAMQNEESLLHKLVTYYHRVLSTLKK